MPRTKVRENDHEIGKSINTFGKERKVLVRVRDPCKRL